MSRMIRLKQPFVFFHSKTKQNAHGRMRFVILEEDLYLNRPSTREDEPHTHSLHSEGQCVCVFRPHSIEQLMEWLLAATKQTKLQRDESRRSERRNNRREHERREPQTRRERQNQEQKTHHRSVGMCRDRGGGSFSFQLSDFSTKSRIEPHVGWRGAIYQRWLRAYSNCVPKLRGIDLTVNQ